MHYAFLLDITKPLDRIVAQAKAAADAGFAAVGMPQIFFHDSLTVLALVGREVPGVGLFTAVVPTYPRHPVVMAQQALTVQEATGGRLVLGIGLSHQMVIEGMFGYSFERPARHMREYLSVLMPLLRGETASFEGETLKASTPGPLGVQVESPPPVLLAALAPAMLRLAGSVADGTSTWMVGPSTLSSHIVPRITEAADEAGRPAPRVSVGLPVCVTNDVDAARERAARIFAIYGQLPSYRAMLDKEGVEGPPDVAIVGDEETVARRIRELADAGATEFAASVFGTSREEVERTTEVVAAMARGEG